MIQNYFTKDASFMSPSINQSITLLLSSSFNIVCTAFFLLHLCSSFPAIVIIKSLDNRITQLGESTEKKNSFFLLDVRTYNNMNIIFSYLRLGFFFPSYNIFSRTYIYISFFASLFFRSQKRKDFATYEIKNNDDST